MKNRPLAVMCAVFLVIRYLMFLVGMEFQFPPELLEKDGEKIRICGQIYQKEKRETGLTWYLRAGNRAYIVYDSKESPYRIGNTILVTGMFQLFEKASNPGTFDSRSFYQNQNIYGMIFPETIKIKDSKIQYGKEWLFSLRERWKEQLVKRMGEEGTVLSGILLGDKSALDPEVKELYQKNGIAHLLAVSGLHVSFVGMMIYRWMRKAGRSFGLSAAAGIVVLLPYAMMTGFSVSAQRAVFMYVLRMGAEVTGRVYDFPTVLVVSATVILGKSPMSVWDAGFQLSFGAVFAIWAGDLLQKRLKEGTEETSSFWQKLVRAASPGICVQILTFPIILSSYYEFPSYSVLLNIWVIPFMSVVMGAGLLGSAFCLLVPWAADRVLWISKVILMLYEWTCRMTLNLPGSRIITGEPEKVRIFLFYVWIAGSFFLLWKRKKRSGIVILAAAFLVLFFPTGTERGNLELTMLDVGQGDGIYLRTPGGMHCLIDGGSTSEEQLSRYTLEPFLESKGVAVLDYVLISHGDADHINGIQEMLERSPMGVRVRTLVLPEKRFWNAAIEKLIETAGRVGTDVRIMQKGHRIRDKEGASLLCLGPAETYQGDDGNAASMILKFTYERFSVLFTGDLEGEGERAFLDCKEGKGEYTILKTAHHGADGSTSEQFLEQNRFRYALISAGEDNPYGHPGRELLKRLEKYGIKSFCTKESGAVTVKSDGGTMNVQKFLE